MIARHMGSGKPATRLYTEIVRVFFTISQQRGVEKNWLNHLRPTQALPQIPSPPR